MNKLLEILARVINQSRVYRKFWLVALPLALCSASWAEKGIMVVQVKDIQKKPVPGAEIAIEGSGEPGMTDRLGRARVKLDPQTKVNDWVFLQIKPPAGRDLVLISPWDERTQIPPFDNESTNYVPLVVVARGDRALLGDPKALSALTAKINKANSPKSKGGDPEQERREALETIAKTFGLTPADVDKAIRAWGEKTEDPYEQGLAALYEKNYPLASQRLSQSFEARKKGLVKAQAATADAASFLGQSRYQEGKYQESVAAYREAQKLQPDNPVFLNNLALSLKEAGDYAGAEPLYRRAIAIAEKALGPDHPDVGIGLSNLGELLQAKGDYAGAEPLYRQALAIAEKALGPDHPTVGTRLNNLALLLKAKGDYAGAEPLYRRALAIDEKALGPDHPDVGVGLNNLAALLRAKGDYAKAEPLYRRALAIDDKSLGPDHPTVGTHLNNLAELLQAKGDYAGAEPLYRQALAIAEKSLGPDHPDVGRDLNNLAELLRAKGDYAGAEPLYRRALAIDEKALGPDHPDVGRDLNNLALLLKAKGDYAAAEPLLRRALAITGKRLGPDHLTTRTIRANLAILLEEKNKAIPK
jgi:tetratricopeptide (TPR) repeat protein